MASLHINPGFSRRRSTVLTCYLVAAAILMMTLAACNTTGDSDKPVQSISPAPPLTKLPVPPPVIITIISPQERQSFRPLSAVDLAATATKSAEFGMDQESSPGSLATNEPFSTPVPTSTAKPVLTEMPTFTPPASPETSPREHYWLSRPVPEGSTVWTDKAYPYGNNRNGTLRTHHGVEFNVPTGTEVLATANGTIVTAGQDNEELLGDTKEFYGNVIVIQHDSGLGSQAVFTLYGHLSEIFVSVGDHVRAQDVIGLSGASGVADGAHLHFEVRLGENSYGTTRNPLLWLYPFPDRGVVAGLVSTAGGLPIASYPVTLRRLDATSPYAGGTTYADDSVNPDETWQENFVFDDVVAGYYELTAGSGEDKEQVEFWVYPYQTSFVQVIIED